MPVPYTSLLQGLDIVYKSTGETNRIRSFFNSLIKSNQLLFSYSTVFTYFFLLSLLTRFHLLALKTRAAEIAHQPGNAMTPDLKVVPKKSNVEVFPSTRCNHMLWSLNERPYITRQENNAKPQFWSVTIVAVTTFSKVFFQSRPAPACNHIRALHEF